MTCGLERVCLKLVTHALSLTMCVSWARKAVTRLAVRDATMSLQIKNRAFEQITWTVSGFLVPVEVDDFHRTKGAFSCSSY
jgi:hypothetical protein